MPFSDRILDLATRIAPAGRKDWARAMRAEHVALQHGRLGWAAGSLATALGWRVRADGPYLAALGLGVWLVEHDFELVVYAFKGLGVPFFLACLIVPTLVAFALGLWQPERARLTAAVIPGLFVLIGTMHLHGFPDEVIGLPGLGGMSAMFLACLGSGVVGGELRRLAYA